MKSLKTTQTRRKSFLDSIDFWVVIKYACIILFILFLVYPLFALFRGSVLDVETGKFTFSNYIRFFSEEFYYEAFKNSMVITFYTTVFSIIVGFILAYLMVKYIIHGSMVLKVLTLVSLMSPPFIGAYSWILLLGQEGIIRRFFDSTFGIELPNIYGMVGILCVFILKLFPFIFLYVSGALKSIDSSLEEAAEGLGSNNIQKIIKVTVPLIVPTLLAGALLVSMTALADFGTPLLLGRGIETLPVLIYDEFVSELGGNSYFASAISVVIVAIATFLFLLQRYFVNRKSYEMSALRPIAPQKLKGIKNIIAHLYCYILVILATLPQLTVLYYSFRATKGYVFSEGYTLAHYARVFDKLSVEIVNSFVYASIAIAFMILFALFISYLSVRRRSFSSTILDVMVMLPYIIPGTVLGIMYAIAFNSGPLVLTGSSSILVIVYIIRRGPSVVRSSSGILYQVSPSIEEASISLGVAPIRSFFKTTAILMIPGVISGALLAWIRTISELSATIMLYVGKTRTMPVATYSEIIYGRYGSAAAMSTILVVSTTVVLILFFTFSKRDSISL